MFSTTRSRPPIARGASRLVALTSAGSLALVGLVALAAPAQASTGVCAAPVVAGATTTITCAAGGTGSVTVPADVSSAAVTLDGAGGGPSVDGVAGGKGAQVVATLAVTPGATLNVAVGSQGTTASGYPGYGGLGGGLVDVTTSTGAALLTAGSGGGAGGPGIGTPAFAGSPGGNSDSPGSAGNGQATAGGGAGGGAGSATAGGAGGAGGTGASFGNNGLGGSGSLPNAAGGVFSHQFYIPAGGGGNGGAGYTSGGAGGAGGEAGSTSSTGTGGGGGGGGGGSSYVSGTVPGTPSSVTDGVNTGNGSIVFVFTQTPTVTSVSPSSGPPAGGNTVTITGTNLTDASIAFGSSPATGVSCTSTSCTATAPAGTAPDTVDVTATTLGGTSATSPADQYTYAAADLGVTLAATGVPGLLGGHINYTITITNNGPSALTSATVTATLPTPMTATSSDCTATSGQVTCALGALASGASTTRAFTAPIGLLTLGLPYAVTATRTASSPVDLNPANDSATRTCIVVTSLIISCS